MNTLPEEGLAKAFDQLCTLADMTHQEHVIAWHMERPEAFKWFVEGVMYERKQWIVVKDKPE